MSDVTNRRVEHIFRKYPELLTSLCDIRSYEMINSKSCNSTLRRVLRKDSERFRRLKRARKSPYSKLNQFGKVFLDILDKDKELFTCPICRAVLDVPVTIECGHTFCAECLNKANIEKCCCCLADVQPPRRIDVLIKDLVGKWREIRDNKFDSLESEVIANLGLEPRYHLRSRYAGLLPKSGNVENATRKIVSRFLMTAKEQKINTEDHDPVVKQQDFSKCIARRGYFTHMDISCREIPSDDFAKETVDNICKQIDEVQDETLKASWSHITKSDLDCILCGRCFYDPVTTTCGHTFCRTCLLRVLDHGLSCPLCVAPLTNPEQNRGTNYALEKALKLLLPEEYEERRQAEMEEISMLDKSNLVPVFVCTNAFPGVACPLLVNEARYRLLTRRCLQSSSRTFAMAARTETSENFTSYGSMLEVKDAVLLEDGGFILTTVGTRRFKVLSKGEQDGYDTAAVQYIRDSAIPPEKLPDLTAFHHKVHKKASRWVRSLTPQALAEVERYIGPMPRVEKNWTALPDGPAWMWWLMPILPLSPQLRVGFLRSTNLEKRLRAIDKMFERLKVLMKKALEREALDCANAQESGESCGFEEASVSITYSN